MSPNFETIVARVWPDGESRWEILGGGITNHNLKVTRPDGVFVLRVAGEGTELLGIDRRTELEATRAAAAVGVGPEVVDFLEPEGWLVTRFVEGEIPPLERMREPETLQRVARALRAVHSGPPIPGRFNSFRIVEDYRTTTFDRGAEVPPTYAWARQVARRIEQLRRAAPERPCHNDLLNANFIDDGRRVRIVDWEYAGMGDVFFDLANFAINHELDLAGREALLETYFGAVRPGPAARARADAVHVRLPRGDVGRRAVGRLTARLRLRGLRRRALRADAAHGRRAGVHGGARRVVEGAPAGAPSTRC